MTKRTLRSAIVLSLPLAVVFACGGDDNTAPDTADACSDGCDASVAKSDATSDATGASDVSAADVGADAKDAGSDASDASDATNAKDASDAGDAADATDAASLGDANVYPADGGAPTGPTLLLTDTTANRIDLLSTTGVVLHSYTSPVANVTGVTYDRRARDGFWVVGRDSAQAFYKTAWSGASMGSISGKSFVGSALRGIDHWVPADAGPDADLLTVVETNGTSIDALSGFNALDGKAQFQMGFYANGAFDGGFWGVSFVNFSEAANEMLAWVSHDTANDAVERWRTASIQASVPIAIAKPRGMARTAAGELWVVDAGNKKVVHLDAAGNVLGSFTTPGNDPAGLSYDPGP